MLKLVLVAVAICVYYAARPSEISFENTEGFAAFLVLAVLPLMIIPMLVAPAIGPPGAPNRVKKGFVVAALAAVTTIGMAHAAAWWVRPTPPSKHSIELDRITSAKMAVEQKLRDPDSAQFRNVVVTSAGISPGTVCGEVNGRNAFGGMTGFQRFISAGTPSSTFLEEETENGFGATWNDICTKN